MEKDGGKRGRHLEKERISQKREGRVDPFSAILAKR